MYEYYYEYDIYRLSEGDLSETICKLCWKNQEVNSRRRQFRLRKFQYFLIKGLLFAEAAGLDDGGASAPYFFPEESGPARPDLEPPIEKPRFSCNTSSTGASKP